MKNCRIYFRVTNEQKQQLILHAKEEQLTLTSYILRHALSEEKERDDEDKGLMKELHRIGVNLNQIARSLHRGKHFTEQEKELHQLIQKLDTCCDEILTARKAYLRELQIYHRDFLNLCREENKTKEMQKKLDASIQLKKLELKKIKIQKEGIIHGYPKSATKSSQSSSD
ncbi:plasmid mobilization protein [Megasphaera vaginalis (ex Srinivasan et al. 2021)]|nr:plasmid mobilization relaxosome protein MobC [Megasphaera vaginalis (ex Srinivasan et al. 2021)]